MGGFLCEVAEKCGCFSEAEELVAGQKHSAREAKIQWAVQVQRGAFRVGRIGFSH